MALLLLLARRSAGTTRNCDPAVGSVAVDVDVAVVVGDDAIGDRQAQADPLPVRRRVKNGSNRCSRTSSVMPQPLSVNTSSACLPSARTSTTTRPPGDRCPGVGEEVEHDLLDLLGIDRREDRPAGQELDLLAVIFAQVADHVDHALRPARAGRCSAAWRRPGGRNRAVVR